MPFLESTSQPVVTLTIKGLRRCPGCPKSKNQKRELEENPKWKNWYLTAFKHMLENLDTDQCDWKTPEDVYKWWIGENEKYRAMDGQEELPCEFM